MQIGLIVAIVANVLFALVVLWGVMWGAIRGLKSSALRFGMEIMAIIFAFVFAPLVTNAVLAIQFPIDGSMMNLGAYLTSLITSNPEIAGALNASPALQALVSALPFSIALCLVFVILLILFKLFFLLLFTIINSLTIKKSYKRALKDSKNDEDKPKKHRVYGAAIGFVHAFVMMFLIFIPVNGVVSIFNGISNQVAEMADETTEKTASAKLLEQYVPTEVFAGINSYSSSALSFTTNLFGLSGVCFDSLTKMNIDGSSAYLRNEVNQLSLVYNNIDYFLSLDISSENFRFKDLKFDLIEQVIEDLFNSNIANRAFPELFVYYAGQFANSDGITNAEYGENIKAFIMSISELVKNDPNTALTIKNDVLALEKTFRSLAECGVIDELVYNKSLGIQDITKLLSFDGKKPIQEFYQNLFSSSLVRKVVGEGVNLGLQVLSQTLNYEIGQIDVDAIKWTNVKSDLMFVTNAFVDIFNTYDFENLETISVLDLEFLVNKICPSLDCIKDSELFRHGKDNVDIYSQILKALNTSAYGEYLDFTAMTGTNVWKNTGNEIIDAMKAVETFAKINLETVDFENLDYAYFENIFNRLANGKAVSMIKPKAIELLNEKISGNSFAEYVKAFTDGLDSTKLAKELAGNIKIFINSFKVLGQSGILTAIVSNNLNINDLFLNLNTIGEENVKSALTSVFSTKSLQNVAYKLVNNFVMTEENGLAKLGIVNFDKVQVDVSNIASSLFAILEELDKLDYAEIAKQQILFLRANTDILFSELGSLLDTIKGTEILVDGNGKSALDALLPKFNLGAFVGEANFTNLFNALKKPVNLIKQMGVLDLFNEDLGYQFNDEKLFDILELVGCKISAELRLEDLVLPLFESDVLVNQILNPLIDNIMKNENLKKIANFEPLKEGKGAWESELGYLSDILNRLATGKITDNGKQVSYLRYVISGKEVTALIKELTYENSDGYINDVDALLNPILSSRVFTPLLTNVFDTIESIINVEGVVIDISNLNLKLQAAEITSIFKPILKMYESVKNGFNYQNADKVALGEVLDAMRGNAYRNDTAEKEKGIFKETYFALLNFMKRDASIGGNVTKILNVYTKYGTEKTISFSGLISLVDNLAASAGNLTDAVKKSFKDVILNMTSDTDIANISTILLDASEKIKNVDMSIGIEPIKEVLMDLEPYQLIFGDGAVQNKIDDTIDLLVDISGFDEFLKIKGINITKQIEALNALIAMKNKTENGETLTIDDVLPIISKDVAEQIEFVLEKSVEANYTIEVPENVKVLAKAQIDSQGMSESVKNHLYYIFKLTA